jgi:hypothetical protein
MPQQLQYVKLATQAQHNFIDKLILNKISPTLKKQLYKMYMSSTDIVGRVIHAIASEQQLGSINYYSMTTSQASTLIKYNLDNPNQRIWTDGYNVKIHSKDNIYSYSAYADPLNHADQVNL